MSGSSVIAIVRAWSLAVVGVACVIDDSAVVAAVCCEPLVFGSGLSALRLVVSVGVALFGGSSSSLRRAFSQASRYCSSDMGKRVPSTSSARWGGSLGRAGGSFVISTSPRAVKPRSGRGGLC